MASSTDDEVVHEFGTFLRVYKSGRLERPLAVPPAVAGLDPATGVNSKDVCVGPCSARLYLPPAAANEKLAIIVYIHGGGFVSESASSPHYHRFLNVLAAACSALCVSVDYRLAPEHPLPAAYEDSLAALRWVLSAADEPWVAACADHGRVFLVGDSVGANICHHVALQPAVEHLAGAVLHHNARHDSS